MPLLILSFIVQIACAIHVVRTGRSYIWLWIVLVFPGIGCIIYIITQVMPDVGASRTLNRAARKAADAVDPERNRRQLEDRLRLSDTVENRMTLAKEALRLGDFSQAVAMFQSCLKGTYAGDPAIMLQLAQAQFGMADWAGCRDTLDRLIATNPGFKSTDGHLLYARSLEGMGDDAAAAAEYATLVQSYPGEEARARYGQLLERMGRAEEAHGVYREIRERVRAAPKFYRRNQQEWLKVAERQLQAPP